MEIIPRHKYNVLQYLGSAYPKLSIFQKEIIRKQLDERYCSFCGEYIYNPYRRRRIRHYHHLRKKAKFVPLIRQRLSIHPRNQLVEWTRRFPNVMRLLTSEKQLLYYQGCKPHFVHRIPAVHMWTIDEWNLLYPTIFIWKHDGSQRIGYTNYLDYLFTPDLVVV